MDTAWLDEFLDAAENALGAMDLATLQPTSWRHTQPLNAPEWLEWFDRIIQAQKEKGVPFEKLAKTLPPDLCREHLFFTLEDLKAAKWPREKRLEVAEFFHQMLKAQMEPGDLFGLHGSTRPKLDLAAILRKKFHAGTPEAARALGKLYNAAYNLGAALYLDYYMGNAIENYGPYPLPGGRTLVVKEMRRLKPAELWPERTTIADRLRLYCVYEDVTFATDLIACHTFYEGDPINGLKAWRLERDGKEVKDVAEVGRIMQSVAENGRDQWIEVTGLPEAKLIEKANVIRCFTFKPLCDALGLQWTPSRRLLKAAEGKTLQDGWDTWKPPKGEKARKAYWRKIWDPRIDFYP